MSRFSVWQLVIIIIVFDLEILNSNKLPWVHQKNKVCSSMLWLKTIKVLQYPQILYRLFTCDKVSGNLGRYLILRQVVVFVIILLNVPLSLQVLEYSIGLISPLEPFSISDAVVLNSSGYYRVNGQQWDGITRHYVSSICFMWIRVRHVGRPIMI